MTDAVVDQRGLRGFVGNYAVIVDRQVSVTGEDRIKWSDRGTVRTLDIRGLHNPSRIDELPVLDAELRP